jgi:hypothetical protein
MYVMLLIRDFGSGKRYSVARNDIYNKDFIDKTSTNVWQLLECERQKKLAS